MNITVGTDNVDETTFLIVVVRYRRFVSLYEECMFF